MDQGLPQRLRRLRVGIGAHGALGDAIEVLDRLRAPGGAREVVGEPVEDLVDAACVHLLQRLARRLVERLAARGQEPVVGHVLGEGVLEDVDGLVGADRLVDEFQALQLVELRLERCGAVPDGPQEAQRELAAEHRGGLEDTTRLVGKPVHARGEDVLDRLGHLLRGLYRPVVAPGPGQLLEEERVALGAQDTGLGPRHGDRVVVEHRLDDGERIGGGQARQRELRCVRLAHAWPPPRRARRAGWIPRCRRTW